MSNRAVSGRRKCESTKLPVTASNVPSRNGRSIAWAATKAIEGRSRRPTSSIPTDGSIPTARAPASAAACAATPVPVPTSSTFFPSAISANATRSRATSARRGAWTRSYASATSS